MTRIKSCILTNAIVPELECAGEVREGKADLVKKLEAVQMVAAKKILGCSKTMSTASIEGRFGNVPT